MEVTVTNAQTRMNDWRGIGQHRLPFSDNNKSVAGIGRGGRRCPCSISLQAHHLGEVKTLPPNRNEGLGNAGYLLLEQRQLFVVVLDGLNY